MRRPCWRSTPERPDQRLDQLRAPERPDQRLRGALPGGHVGAAADVPVSGAEPPPGGVLPRLQCGAGCAARGLVPTAGRTTKRTTYVSLCWCDEDAKASSADGSADVVDFIRDEIHDDDTTITSPNNVLVCPSPLPRSSANNAGGCGGVPRHGASVHLRAEPAGRLCQGDQHAADLATSTRPARGKHDGRGVRTRP